MSWTAIALGYRAFRLPRHGHGLEECQDALAADVQRGRFAIADGAAESPYASLWARLLVEEFVRQSERLPSWASWLPSLQQRWIIKVSGTVAETVPDTFLNGVPWYLQAGLNQGAFTTFLGLVIEENKWCAMAVGDSCLFQVRREELIRAFPVTRAVDFSNAPWLIGSRTSPSEVPHKNGLQQLGDCQSGDRLLLMTDALAQWFLTQAESGGKPWQALGPLAHAADDASAQQAFATWIEELRHTRRLRNDDVTLPAVSVEPGAGGDPSPTARG
jgi:hypothetical protein